MSYPSTISPDILILGTTSLSDTGKQLYRGELGGEVLHYGQWENDEKRAVFILILWFLHQFALISKEIHCLLSLHDDFDYK